jgi:hypothetical protein
LGRLCDRPIVAIVKIDVGSDVTVVEFISIIQVGAVSIGLRNDGGNAGRVLQRIVGRGEARVGDPARERARERAIAAIRSQPEFLPRDL